MLDKSVPYFQILMKCDKNIVNSMAAFPPPPDFRCRTYREGDARKWAEIEASVGEFENIGEAEEYFAKTFLPFEEQLKERCLFIEDKSGNCVATATAWYFGGENSGSVLQWIAVKPEYQKMGLGRAVITNALSLFYIFEPGMDVYLRTQTWSYRAVGLYLKVGFRMLKSGTFGNNENEYTGAVDTLMDLMSPEMFELMIKTAL